MQVDTIKSKYAEAPNIWNLSAMLTLGGILWAATAFFINAQFTNHSISESAHPQITEQLDRVEANQLRGQIFNMNNLLCSEPNNIVYQQELAKLITEWETLTEQTFPQTLLRCARGSA